MSRPVGLLLLVASTCVAQAAGADQQPVAAQLQFESCPAVELDVQSRPWLSKPLLARLSVSSTGSLENIGVAQSSGLSAVDESFFSWLAACKFISEQSGSSPSSRELLVAVRVQSPDTEGAASTVSRGLADCQSPIYPSQATRKNQQGNTMVKLFVANDGAFVAASVAKSSGHAALDYAALARPRAWQRGSTLAAKGSIFQAEYKWTLR
jgi:TonB family protein